MPRGGRWLPLFTRTQERDNCYHRSSLGTRSEAVAELVAATRQSAFWSRLSRRLKRFAPLRKASCASLPCRARP
jgi:hypothetical protein